MTRLSQLLLESPLWDVFDRLFKSYADALRQFSNGDPVAETVIFDNEDRIATFELGASGVATFVAEADDQAFLSSEFDIADEFIWDSIVERFDDNGQLASRTSTADNGFVQIDTYADGERIAKDLIDGADEFVWAEVRNLYDGAERTAKETIFDNGVFRLDTFADGQRNRTQQTDDDDVDTFVWSTIDASYEDGEIVTRTITYDDGSMRDDTFVGGVRTTAVQSDAPSSQHVWELITTTYDFGGDLSSRSITYDTGVLRTDTFSSGNRMTSTQTDAADVFDWATSERLYEAGIIASQRTLEDDGDVIVLIYENGARDRRVEHDVDGDQLWQVRLTIYDADGVQSVDTFADTSILADYPAFFENDDVIIDIEVS